MLKEEPHLSIDILKRFTGNFVSFYPDKNPGLKTRALKGDTQPHDVRL